MVLQLPGAPELIVILLILLLVTVPAVLLGGGALGAYLLFFRDDGTDGAEETADSEGDAELGADFEAEAAEE